MGGVVVGLAGAAGVRSAAVRVGAVGQGVAVVVRPVGADLSPGGEAGGGRGAVGIGAVGQTVAVVVRSVGARLGGGGALASELEIDVIAPRRRIEKDGMAAQAFGVAAAGGQVMAVGERGGVAGEAVADDDRLEAFGARVELHPVAVQAGRVSGLD